MLKLWRRPGSKKGIWRMRGTVGGVRYDESTGTDSRSHAEAIAAQRNTELLDRLVFGPERTTTFAEAVTMYLEQGGEARFLEPLTRAFGPRRMSDISQADVHALIRQRYRDTGPQGINRQVFTPLIAVFRAAHKSGMGPPPAFTRPKLPRRPAVRFATDDDLAALIPHCNARLRAAVLLMSLGGARASEACRLTRRDVDWTSAEITLRETKNGAPRVISAGPLLMSALHEISGATTGAIADDGVGAPLFGCAQRHSLGQALKRACARAGIAPAWTTHEVGRHAFAARLLGQGHTLLEVQKAGGWKTYRMVAEVYGHLERSHVDAIVREAGANLVRALGGERLNVIPIRKKSA